LLTQQDRRRNRKRSHQSAAPVDPEAIAATERGELTENEPLRTMAELMCDTQLAELIEARERQQAQFEELITKTRSPNETH